MPTVVMSIKYKNSTEFVINIRKMKPKIYFLFQALHLLLALLEIVKIECADRNHLDLIYNHSNLRIFYILPLLYLFDHFIIH